MKTEQLQKYARMMRIELSDEELTAMNIPALIDRLATLRAVDTSGATPMISPATHALPLRADVVTDGNIRDAVLANAPDAMNGYFTVPKVMEE